MRHVIKIDLAMIIALGLVVAAMAYGRINVGCHTWKMKDGGAVTFCGFANMPLRMPD